MVELRIALALVIPLFDLICDLAKQFLVVQKATILKVVLRMAHI